MKGKKIIVAAVMLAAAALTGTASAIFNGEPVSDREALDSGMVKVGGEAIGLCSGILLANDWVLTAAHCGVRPYKPSVSTALLGQGSTQPPHEFYGETADFSVWHPSLDVALFHLRQPLPVLGGYTGYKRGLYPGITRSLEGKTLVSYGYGYYDAQLHSGELHKANYLANGLFDDYTLGLTPVIAGQDIQAGDSGGPTLTAGPAGGVVAGVTKTQNRVIRPEHFYDWALSYLYNRPVELPKAWFLDPVLYPGQYSKFWDAPLQNNFENHVDFDPCPGGSYAWTAHYYLEPNKDFIYISSRGITTALTGYNATSTGRGQGPLTIKVKTNESVQSLGLASMQMQCDFGNLLPNPLARVWTNPWPKPLPKNFAAEDSWSACVDGASFGWEAAYSFEPGDAGQLAFTDAQGQPAARAVSGQGILIGEALTGPLKISVSTVSPPSSSIGFARVSAVCHTALECHGPTCFTLPAKLPHNQTLKRVWDPCNGRGFVWTAAYDFERNKDYLIVKHSDQSLITLTGKGTMVSVPETGPIELTVKTGATGESQGLRDLSAVCQNW